jgi:hypothetical protein
VHAAHAQCEKPRGLSVFEVTEVSAILQWIGDDLASEYEIDIRSKGRTPKLKRTYNTIATNFAVNDLVPGSEYRFRVRSSCDSGASSGSTKWFTFETSGMSPDESCPKASDLQLVGATMTTATLSWTGSVFSSHYEVEVRSKGSTPVYVFEKSLLDTTITVFGLDPTGHYQFRVRSTCVNDAVSGSTSWYHFNPGEVDEEQTCPFVTDLFADSITSQSALIHWSSSDQNVVYQLIVAHESGDDIEIAPATPPQFIDGLLPDTEYEIMIISNCEDGIPSQVSASFMTASEVMDSCTIPQELAASALDSSGYLLSWQSMGGADSYDLQIKKLDSLETIIIDTSVSGVSYLFTAMDSLDSFAFRVRMLCSSESMSEYSEWYFFPAIADSLVLVCESPLDLMVDTVLGNNAFISWSHSGTNSYELEIRNADTTWQTMVVSSSMHPIFVLADLQPFTDYEIRIRALCDREQGSFSSVVNFSTLEVMIVCLPPDGLEADRVDDSTAIVSWIGDDTASYQVEVKSVDPLSTTSLLLTSQNPSLLVSGLNTSETYQFRVRMICSPVDTSLFSQWIPFSTIDTMVMDCESPTNLGLDSLSDTKALVSWEGPESILYRLLIKERDTIVEYDEFLTEEHFMYFDSLMPETEYQVYVQSICGEEESSLSEPLYFMTLMTADTFPDSLCMAPEEIRLDSVDIHNAWISWVGDDSVTYSIEVTAMEYSFSASTSNPMIHLMDLSADQEFSVRIRLICNDMDTSEWSEPFIFQTLEEPFEPADSCSVPIADLLQVTGETASVSWSASSAEAFYIIEVENIGLTPEYSLITTTRDTGYLIESLLPGGTYQWKVAAFCEGGMYSDCTPWMIIQTAGEVDCPPPSGLAIEMLTNTSANLVWDVSPGAIDYEVEIQSLDTTPFYDQTSIIMENHLIAEALVQGGIYQYKVNVQCLDGTISEDTDWYVFSILSGQDTGNILSNAGSSLHMVYPNPVHSTMTVKLPEVLDGSDATIELTDMMGRLIFSHKSPEVFGGDQLEFEVSSFREGVYRLSVRSAENQFQELVLITK